VPTAALVLLSAAVAFYMGVLGAAALGLVRGRHRSPPDPPPSWPSLSVRVVGSDTAERLDECLASLRACDYPNDRYDIVVPTAREGTGLQSFSKADGSPSVHVRPPSGSAADRPSSAATAPTRGDICVTIHADCTVPPGWLQALARRCTPETPVVAGPVVYEHDDLFWPRLQALEQVGFTAFGAGLQALGLSTIGASTNVARYHGSARSPNAEKERRPGAPADLLRSHTSPENLVVALDRDARVTVPPSPSFEAYLRRRARALRTLFSSAAAPPLLATGVLWGTHVVLLLGAGVALGTPAWRQPVLLGLVAKMGADTVLALPSARRLGQRGLLRSLVPTELLLVVAVPLAGALALADTIGAIDAVHS